MPSLRQIKRRRPSTITIPSKHANSHLPFAPFVDFSDASIRRSGFGECRNCIRGSRTDEGNANEDQRSTYPALSTNMLTKKKFTVECSDDITKSRHPA